LRVDSEGFLTTARGSRVWVHTTNTPTAKFLTEGFRFSRDAFYLASAIAGEDLNTFGRNALFITYKPTRIFAPTDGAALTELVECLRGRTTPEAVLAAAHAILNIDGVFDLDEIRDIYEGDPFEFVYEQLSRGYYAAYERIPGVRACLEGLGYTAYIESESGEATGRDNVAVLRRDFDRLTIAAAVESEAGLVRCPVCGERAGLDDVLRATTAPGEAVAVQCGRCAGRA
jgi:hypothetical protein